ncbi:BlaI/MecI/CopY family transcriptional regulator [Kribbella pittospori]|uniref:BlaI/MecI/CopY family transcriptional regulator n=1 Tax=Kribbella pittospori TaxID=722689 RepID=A0A4R0JIX0_9ACTN|nr:BlaI/MecI/CopY family transcriptional regulator [Kribbella pittospori]TCC47023.1 BlaI/MecI/CopY family transcriptional regulator [Kribbella pittospori]
MASRGQSRGRGDLEQQVFAALAAGGGPMTTSEVRDALGGQLAYTTVMTVLARMQAKGLATRTRAGRSYAYSAVVDAAEVTAHQIHRLLDSRGDRAAVLTRFAGGLSAEESALLLELLADSDSDSEAEAERP